MAAAVALVGCEGTTLTPIPTQDPFSNDIPSSAELLPAGVVAATEWMGMPSLPEAFDARVAYPSAQAAAEAFGEALSLELQGEELGLDTYRYGDDRALLVITVLGVGDDSVAGSQYALDWVHESDGWVLYQTWDRFLCRRGVEDGFCV